MANGNNTQLYTLHIDEVKSRLEGLTGALSGMLLDAALEAGGVIQASATQRAPIDIGHLRSSINCWQGHVDDHSARVHVGVRDCVSADGAPYPIYIEYGTGIYAEGGNGRKTPWVWVGSDASVKWRGAHRTRGMRPQPFLRPALEENRDVCLQIIREHLGDGLSQEARKS